VAIYRNGRPGEYIGGLREELFDATASRSIHSAELINLRVRIRRYARSSLLLCAIGEFVRRYLGRRETRRLNHPVGVESPTLPQTTYRTPFHPIE
jgi:hypothetical protein